MDLKKAAAFTSAAILGCTMLCACGSGSSSQTDASSAVSSDSSTQSSSAEQSSAAPAQPTEYDTTVFTVSVPSGWTAAAVSDVLKKFDGVTNPEQVYVIKGGKTSDDIMRYPYIWASYYKDANTFTSSKGFYKDAEDLAPTEIGGRTWEGYKYTSSGYPGACLTCKEGEAVWVCNFVLKNGENEITLQDEDVKTVLSSLKLKL